MNWKFWTWAGQIRTLKAQLKKCNLDFADVARERADLEKDNMSLREELHMVKGYLKQARMKSQKH